MQQPALSPFPYFPPFELRTLVVMLVALPARAELLVTFFFCSFLLLILRALFGFRIALSKEQRIFFFKAITNHTTLSIDVMPSESHSLHCPLSLASGC